MKTIYASAVNGNANVRKIVHSGSRDNTLTISCAYFLKGTKAEVAPDWQARLNQWIKDVNEALGYDNGDSAPRYYLADGLPHAYAKVWVNGELKWDQADHNFENVAMVWSANNRFTYKKGEKIEIVLQVENSRADPVQNAPYNADAHWVFFYATLDTDE